MLTHYNLSPEVVAFSTTRHGGCSTGAYASLNVNAWCGDAPEHVEANRRLLCHNLGISTARLIMPHQTHGTEIRQIAPEMLTLPQEVRQMLLEGVDAVMTNVKGVCIGVSTADCIPLLIHDPGHHAICAVHAGWRGTAESIARRAIAAMARAYGSHPSDLKAVIGPGISIDAFEVGDEVYAQFEAKGFCMADIAVRHDKWHINLPLCNQLQLIAMGVPQESVTMSDICTYGNARTYFSARRLGTASGRIFNGIMMR